MLDEDKLGRYRVGRSCSGRHGGARTESILFGSCSDTDSYRVLQMTRTVSDRVP